MEYSTYVNDAERAVSLGGVQGSYFAMRNVDYTLAVERRITLRLLAYWEKKRAGRDMPTLQDIDSAELQDLWDHCFMIPTEDFGKEGHTYSYLGEAIRSAYEGSLAHGNPTELLSPDATAFGRHYADMIITGKPVIDEGEYLNRHGDLVKYRQCLLPLGRDGKVEAIFGGMRFKVFATI